MGKSSELFWRFYRWFGLARSSEDLFIVLLAGGLIASAALLRSSAGKVWIASQPAVVQVAAYAALFLLCVYAVAHLRLWREVTRSVRGGAGVTTGSPEAQRPTAGRHAPLRMSAQHEALEEQRPSGAEWHDLEDRFGVLDGEFRAQWIRYEPSGEVVWTVHRVGFQGPCRLEHFLREARVAGGLVKQLPEVPRQFPRVTVPVDAADDWLNAVAGLAPSGAHVDGGSGYNPYRGRFTAGEIRDILQGSKLACARLAAESGQRTGV